MRLVGVVGTGERCCALYVQNGPGSPVQPLPILQTESDLCWQLMASEVSAIMIIQTNSSY